MSSTDLHPLLVSCIFHYEFEFIHPFADGNGRTGRLWHTLLLSHWRSLLAWLPIESVIRGRQADYYAAIASSNTAGTSDSFVTFMLTIIRDALIPYASDSPAQDRQERTLSFFKADPSATTIADLAGHLECAQNSGTYCLRPAPLGASEKRGKRSSRNMVRHRRRWLCLAPGRQSHLQCRSLVCLVTGEPTA